MPSIDNNSHKTLIDHFLNCTLLPCTANTTQSSLSLRILDNLPYFFFFKKVFITFSFRRYCISMHHFHIFLFLKCSLIPLALHRELVHCSIRSNCSLAGVCLSFSQNTPFPSVYVKHQICVSLLFDRSGSEIHLWWNLFLLGILCKPAKLISVPFECLQRYNYELDVLQYH